jgi:hypothetical protein
LNTETQRRRDAETQRKTNTEKAKTNTFSSSLFSAFSSSASLRLCVQYLFSLPRTNSHAQGLNRASVFEKSVLVSAVAPFTASAGTGHGQDVRATGVPPDFSYTLSG